MLSVVVAAVVAGNEIRTAPFDSRIHSFGNVGAWGTVHAAAASFATRVIDRYAYAGRNMRAELAQDIRQVVPTGGSVLEIGCGVGTLTRELRDAGLVVVGAIDTSVQMVRQARREVPGQQFAVLNGVDAKSAYADIDVVVACMLMHELPRAAHVDLLRALLAVLKDAGQLWIVDIDPAYTPSPAMLLGEPYLLEYQETFGDTAADLAAEVGRIVRIETMVEGHVRKYVIA
jgi:trans-aconitate methyltransferase